MEDSFRRSNAARRALLTLPLAVLVSALSCSSNEDDRPGAFAGGTGAGATGGHTSHGGAGGALGGTGGTGAVGGSSGHAGSGGTTPRDAGHDAAEPDGSDGSVADAGPALNGCVGYVDRSAGDDLQTMRWDDDITFAPERCMKVRVGQTVTFVGDFEDHPLAPRGGDSPSPIAEQTQLTEVGVFGFFCTSHPNMTGAIWVVQP